MTEPATSHTSPPLGLMIDKIARVSGQRFAERIADLDIRPRHVGLLSAAARQDKPSQADLGAWLGIGPSAVVAVVDELQALGAVERNPDPANRRRWTITLTGEGTRLLTEAIHRAEELDRDLVSTLPPELAQAFHAATVQIARHLGIAG
jgi:DNA-binding MarR family transcriptional regulator